ncbi:MAG: hypothetical protein ACQEXE_10240 [Bacillota bacterium]
MGKYRAQYEVTLKFTAFVEVQGDFKDIEDARIDAAAEKIVRGMDPRDMAFDSEDYEILDVTEIK